MTRFDWRNPHVYVAVMDQQGREWLLETDGTAVLGRSGWTSQSFRVGDRVAARGFSHRDSSKHHALLLSIAGPDGRQLTSLNRTNDRTVFNSDERAASLAGVWSGTGYSGRAGQTCRGALYLE